MKIDTPTLKKAINKKVKYQIKGSGLWSYDTIIEVVRQNIVFENDARSFSQIKELVLVD